MKFTTIDFETANRERGSVCQVGIAVFENNSVVDTKSWLVKPCNGYFDDLNIHIHGITEQDVVTSPYLDELWSEINSYIDNSLLVAHNASFDISVLRHVLDEYSIPYPSLDYLCSYLLAKNIWDDLLSYKLSYLAKIFKIELNHHDALSDAIASGKILLKGMESLEASSIDELKKELRLTTGSVFERGYTTPSIDKDVKESIEPRITSDLDFDNSFKNKTVVFTGALGFLTRKKAKQLVQQCGGKTKTSVSKKVDVLVVGESDIEKYGEGYKTNKLQKAEKLLKKGHPIELIGENEFLKFCHWAEDKISLSKTTTSGKSNSPKKHAEPAHPLDLYAIKLAGIEVKKDLNSQRVNEIIEELKRDPTAKKIIKDFYTKEMFFEDLFTFVMDDMEFYDVNKVTYEDVIEVGLHLLNDGYAEDDILYDLDLFFKTYQEGELENVNGV